MKERKIICNLKEIREKRGYSKMKVAKICGVSRNLVIDLEKGTRQVKLSSIERLLNGLAVELDELFTLK